MFESLENRRLLSGSGHGGGMGKGNVFDPTEFGRPVIAVEGSRLTISNAHDLQIIEQDRGVFQVNDFSNGGDFADTQFYGTGQITEVVVNGTSGGDILNVGNDYATVTVNAGAGVDRIGVSDNVPTGGGSTTVFAGDGNDVITVSTFNAGTRVFGQGGHDKYTGPAGVFAQ